jgi:tetraacyldisaccharide 4'-kinase
MAFVYGLLVRGRFALYRLGWLKSEHLPVPVVVVGNVVVGGAGKTPTVMALVHHLQAQGQQPGVISRGHRRQAGSGRDSRLPVEVLAHTSPGVCGDEPALIHRNTGAPVFVGQRRAATAKALLKAHPDVTVLVCDDGLQHLALASDVAVAVFDERGVGNGWLLPAGLLREPWPRNVGRHVDVVLQTQPEISLKANTPAVPPHTPVYLARKRLAEHANGLDGEQVLLQSLRGQPLVALAGVAKPELFFDMLRARGLVLGHTVPLSDHQNYDHIFDSELFNIKERLSIICTEKDAIKLFPLLRQRWARTPELCKAWAVPLELDADPAFFTDITTRLHKLHVSVER